MPLRLREQRQLGALGGFSFMDLPGREGVPPPGPGEEPQTSISPAEGSADPAPRCWWSCARPPGPEPRDAGLCFPGGSGWGETEAASSGMQEKRDNPAQARAADGRWFSRAGRRQDRRQKLASATA